MKNRKIVSILMVDDDSLDVEAFERAMHKRHINNPIVHAVDGVEAIEILQDKHIQKIERPYIVLMDINMPRMNGLECIRTMREDAELKDSVTFVMTTSDHEKDIYDAYNLNVAGYLVKSELANNFLSTINMLDSYFQAVVLLEDHD